MPSLEQPTKVPALQEIDPTNALRTTMLGVEYDSPLVVASGTLVERYDQIQQFVDAGAGAVIPRSTRFVMSRTVHPSPHLYQVGVRSRTTMMNAEWTGADINYWREYLPDMGRMGKVIMGVSGRDIEGCVEVCKELDEFKLPFIEINVSCGVSNGVHGFITRDPDHIAKVCDDIKKAGVETPIGVKLGHSDKIVELAQKAQENGADLIIASNTYGPVLDFEIDGNGNPQRVLGVIGAKGGISGDAIFHIALTDVADLCSVLDIPVVASGGVTTAERALKMIYAGASLVQIYSLLHDSGLNAPAALTKLTRGLVSEIETRSIKHIDDVRGKALSLLSEPTELSPQVPIVDKDICTGCDRCVPVCLPEAITFAAKENRNGHVIEIGDESCIGCGHCVTQCPVNGALKLPDMY